MHTQTYTYLGHINPARDVYARSIPAGTAERVFKDPNILLEEVTAHLDQPMAFYVYNTKTDEVCDCLLAAGFLFYSYVVRGSYI